MILSPLASQVARIIGMNHPLLANMYSFKAENEDGMKHTQNFY
jgi:hypothetical protein